MHDDSVKVMEIVDNLPINDNYEFIPVKEIDDIPMKWFMAAEKALRSSNGIVNKNAVKYLALDAFIQHSLNN